MAIYKDYYELEVKVGGRIVDILPTSYSFIMKDSIYNLYNTMSVNLYDYSGLLQEYLATVEGLNIEVTYGITNEGLILKCNYVIKSDALNVIQSPGFLNGNVDLSLVNAWYDNQGIESAAYQGRVSDVIRTFAADYNFTGGTVVDDTGNESVWYQPLITPARMINEILLPNAYANNANNTPFYCFVTNNNEFNFRNFRAMMESSPLDNLRFEIDKASNFSVQQVSDVKRWRMGSDVTKSLRRRLRVIHNYETGEITTTTESITDFFPTGKPIPILDTSSQLTGFVDLGYTDREVGQSENRSGSLAYSMREGMILERMLISLPFNPKLHAGGTVTLDVYRLTDQPNTKALSKYFSGTYLIEECDHVWNGEEQKGFTKAIIGRKYVDIPSTYSLRGSLII